MPKKYGDPMTGVRESESKVGRRTVDPKTGIRESESRLRRIATDPKTGVKEGIGFSYGGMVPKKSSRKKGR